ncbi:MAG: hypothetical protein P4L42_15955 [Desulfocapsaceae bacterium]|nr:hypothetical protein [Desulfocapsaceae bacterium]
MTPETPAPLRFIVKGTNLIDLKKQAPVFFRGIGYSPYLPNETPIYQVPPGDDSRYQSHLKLMQDMGVNYIHVFPMKMPPKFFTALDATDMVYGQDIWVWAYENDFLAESFYTKTMETIKSVIDYTYKVGRPDRLVVFSVGDELQAESVVRTDNLHPDVHDYTGKHVVVTNRTPTEVALARLIDGAIDYELIHYGQRHLYCHTSWTHIGPIANRSDLELPTKNVLNADMGDLNCLNIYTYARGVRTSPPGSVTKSTYQGYLEELAAQTSKPILITQVGLSTSPFEPKPWVPGFGGHKVQDVPKAFKAIWKDIRTAKGKEKFCGLAFFEFQDEWWKSGKDAAGAIRHDREDPEQWFGIYEVDVNHNLIPKGTIPETIKQIYHMP